MNLLNERVEHIKFGSGVITKSNNAKIAVQFENNTGKKIFQFPEAFESFLKVKNPEVQDDIMNEYHKKQEEIKLERSLEDKLAKIELAIEKTKKKKKKRTKKQ